MKAKTIQDHFDHIAADYDWYKKKNWYYYKHLKILLQKRIPSGSRVLEVGCGTGDVLVSLRPSYGVGIDVSNKMIEIARKKYKNFPVRFYTTDINSFKSKQKFDYIVMSDVIEHLSDLEGSFLAIRNCMGRKTIFINTMANPFWEPVLIIAESLKLKMPEGPHDRISFSSIEAIARMEGLDIYRHGFDTLCPIFIPFVSDWINTTFEPHMSRFAFIEYFQARLNSI